MSRAFVAACAVALVGTLPAAASHRAVAPGPSFPLRAAFYYPWFPGAWQQRGLDHYSQYTPTLGYYSSADPNVVRTHVRAMLWGGIHAGIASRWGRRVRTAVRRRHLLRVTSAMKARVGRTIYCEPGGGGDPAVARIGSALTYI